MQLLRSSLLGAALMLLATGVVWSEEALTGYPAEFEFDRESFAFPERSGSVTPLRLSVQDVRWDGNGSVSIPFTMNQRAEVWLAVYEIGNNTTGDRGPFGAWFRGVPQDLYIATTSARFEAGNSTITWNGRDWEGNAVGSGNYEFDLIAMNHLDPAVLVAAQGRGGRAGDVIDMRTGEVWGEEYGRDRPERAMRWGDLYRTVLGTDLIADPNGWEDWTHNQVVEREGTRTFSPIKPDPDDQEIYFSASGNDGEGVGVYKMRINRAAKSWDAVTDWADNGYAIASNVEARLWDFEIHNSEFIIAAMWSRADVPQSTFDYWDKGTGEIAKQLNIQEWVQYVQVDDDGNEIINAGGPNHLSVDASGVYASNQNHQNYGAFKVNHDGRIIWANGNGDGFIDRVTHEQAAETGMTPTAGFPIQIQADRSGNVVYASPRHNEQGYGWTAVGRDGSGLFHIFFDPHKVPTIPTQVDHINLVQNNCSSSGGQPLCGSPVGPGPWDGWYQGSKVGLASRNFVGQEEGRWLPGLMLHIPYDIKSGRLGAGVTAVAEVESAGTPDSYSLGAAYPNPFNPETTVEFTIPADGYIQIEIYNTAGQLVNSLVDDELSAGAYKSTWDAVDASGQQVSSGVYFYRMQSGEFSATRSVTLLK